MLENASICSQTDTDRSELRNLMKQLEEVGLMAGSY